MSAPDRSRLDPGRVSWDMWPLQDQAEHMALLDGRELGMALCARARGDPALRPCDAKIHWLERMDGAWPDRGPVLPAGPMRYER